MAIEKNMINQLVQDEISFTVLVNESIVSITDCAALGIYTYLSSKPPGWIIRNCELQSHFGKGEEFIKQKLALLRKIGALVTGKIRDEKGRVIRHETTVKKMLIAPSSTGRVSLPMDNPPGGESGPIKERYIKKKDNIYISCAIEKKEQESAYQETYFPSPENITQHLSEQEESDETFEAFWQLYPIKKGKKRAKAAWFAQRCYKDVHMILTKLDEQVRKDRQFLDGYPPHPTTYIHGKRWEDEVVPPAPSRVKRQSFAELDQNSDWHKEFHKDRF